MIDRIKAHTPRRPQHINMYGAATCFVSGQAPWVWEGPVGPKPPPSLRVRVPPRGKGMIFILVELVKACACPARGSGMDGLFVEILGQTYSQSAGYRGSPQGRPGRTSGDLLPS